MEHYVDIEGLLQKYRISMADLSRLTGIERPNLSRIKKNKIATLGSISKIAQALNIKDVNEIVKVR
ncbi:helix-turn-helix domain-containing protein [Bacillus mycoides]|uniref:helix-turn-helix domain-containing protein n=1 Tax=Bacillus mycoides TaxID=1405 RepID=UPI001C02ECB0|nr:helix-turn-helix transcriptional regulator [Bacillus mycoides]QWI37997.1 XRE family transcriptional regulator [Bacillus mycoides]